METPPVALNGKTPAAVKVFPDGPAGTPAQPGPPGRIRGLNARTKDEISSLRDAMARLMLVVEAQQRLLLEKGVFTPDAFKEMLRTVDAEDGTVDCRKRP